MAYEGQEGVETKEQETNKDDVTNVDLRQLPDGVQRLHNLADQIPNKTLDEEGAELLQQVTADITSRSDWLCTE